MGPWTRRSLPILLGLALGWAPVSQATSVGVYFDPQGSSDVLKVSALQTFQYFVLADGVSEGVKAFEMNVRMDPRITVLTRQLGSSDAVNVSSSTDNWIVGFGSCVSTQPASLVVYSAMLLSEGASVTMSLEASEPSSVSGIAPAYLPCGSTTVAEFETVSGAVLNPDEQSWGAVKHLYD